MRTSVLQPLYKDTALLFVLHLHTHVIHVNSTNALTAYVLKFHWLSAQKMSQTNSSVADAASAVLYACLSHIVFQVQP
jgi:hypothetical protein